jgi:hypothetical protein
LPRSSSPDEYSSSYWPRGFAWTSSMKGWPRASSPAHASLLPRFMFTSNHSASNLVVKSRLMSSNPICTRPSKATIAT